MKTDSIWNSGANLPACIIGMKEMNLGLSLETSTLGEVTVMRCKGRIVFRDEAAALSQAVGKLLEQIRQMIVLDLEGVTVIDSAGLGELVALHMWVQGSGGSIKFCGLSSRIRHLLEITNLTSMFEVYPTQEDAIDACATEVARDRC